MKIKIGVLCLTLLDYDSGFPGLKESRENFIRRALEPFGDEFDMLFTSACNTRSQIEDTVRNYEYEQCAALLVIMLTYSPSVIALPALQRTYHPIIFFDTQELASFREDARFDALINNHGVHGVQDLCSVLQRCKIAYHIVAGHYADEKVCVRLRTVLRIAGVLQKLRQSRIGLLGYAMQDMGDFYFDEVSFLSQIGPHVIHIPVDVLADYAIEATLGEVDAVLEQQAGLYTFDAGISREVYEENARQEIAMRRIVKEYALDAWSQFFSPLVRNPRIRTAPFMAACKLMAEGVGYAAEGDISATAGQIILGGLAGQASLSEIFTMDFETESCVMSHMAEINIGMARKDQPVRFIPKDFSWASKTVVSPLVPPVSLEAGDATLLSIVSLPDGKYRFVTVEGHIEDFKHFGNIDCPVFRFKSHRQPLSRFLEEYSKVGGTHHHAIAYGLLGGQVAILARMMGIDATML